MYFVLKDPALLADVQLLPQTTIFVLVLGILGTGLLLRGMTRRPTASVDSESMSGDRAGEPHTPKPDADLKIAGGIGGMKKGADKSTIKIRQSGDSQHIYTSYAKALTCLDLPCWSLLIACSTPLLNESHRPC